jgi:hypothetical protein
VAQPPGGRIIWRVLAFMIRVDGGVEISGNVRDLADLIGWIAVAVKHGEATAAYVTDETLTRLRIELLD